MDWLCAGGKHLWMFGHLGDGSGCLVTDVDQRANELFGRQEGRCSVNGVIVTGEMTVSS